MLFISLWLAEVTRAVIQRTSKRMGIEQGKELIAAYRRWLYGRVGKAYFRAQRMIQQACVDTCNREGWVIPFTQITVHSGDAAAGPFNPPA
jgi:hypothetical protein